MDMGKVFRGGQRQAIELHNGLLENGLSSYFVSLENGELNSKSFANKISCKYKNPINFSLTLKEIVENIKPDIVHFHEAKSLNGIYLLKKDIKTVETRRVLFPISTFSIYSKYKICNVHVAVSETVANYLKRYFKNVYIIESFLNTERLDKIIEANPLKKIFQINLLYVGALTKEKSVSDIIYALKKTKYAEKIGLHIVGGGAESENLKSLADKLELSNVIFYGEKNNPQDFYRTCDIFINPSISEGSSGVLKESLYFDLPTVVRDIPTNRYFQKIFPEVRLFDNNSSKDLTKELDSIIEGGLNRLDTSKKVKQLYSLENYVKNYLSLYEDIL